MTAKEALGIATKYAERYGTIDIIQCMGMESFYVFFTNFPNHDEIVPDMPVIQVFKDTGEAKDMFPSHPYIDKEKFEWVNPLEGAKEVDIL